MRSLKRTIFLLLLTISIRSIAQDAKKDTVFLIKEHYGDVYHSVFIEPDRNSKYYDYISNYSFGEFDKQSYDESIEYLKSQKLELTKVSIHDFPKKWIILNHYKNEFYVYAPSDYYFHYKAEITENAYIDYSGEGPSANKISDFIRIDNDTFQFNLEGSYRNERKVVIHLIDPKAGVAVFEETSNDREKFYYLMVDAAKIRNFPLIVNHCKNNKQPEFEFDKVDFVKLINQQH